VDDKVDEKVDKMTLEYWDTLAAKNKDISVESIN
jgi:hypothetical protein